MVRARTRQHQQKIVLLVGLVEPPEDVVTIVLIPRCEGTVNDGNIVCLAWLVLSLPLDLVNAVLGALVFLGIARTLTAVHALVVFWWVFWVGILVAVAFWSALYTHDSSALGS
jgi:hypothetical protein